MCGIFGYIGPRDAVKITLQGLKRLEYRGYDSAGIGGINENDEVVFRKVVGKISDLEKSLSKEPLPLNPAIAHTRWATHGRPTEMNAHPHLDAYHTLALVHNGIIENHEALRRMLKENNVQFTSETDSEVIAHLISHFYEGDILQAIERALPLLQGSFAIAFTHSGHPNEIVAFAKDTPLAIGIGDNESFISSDPTAFKGEADEVLYLSSSEIAIVRADEVETFDASMNKIIKNRELLASHVEDIDKGDFEHFTLKEIFDQPHSLRSAMVSRFSEEYGTALLEGMNIDVNELLGIKRVIILGCGTSWHAGYIAAYLLEDMARLPVQLEISSEFRYKNPIILPDTLAIAISQSGETADTLAAVREIKGKGAHVLGICNVHGSSLAREADGCIFLRAGIEVAVCSTKAFTSQVTLLALFSLMMARMRHMGKEEGQNFLKELLSLPEKVQAILDQSSVIEKVAKKYAAYDHCFFVGRQYMYPTALEGALKLKEISYINANGYPAGELKHGVIALIADDCPTVALCANQATYSKILSNLMEIKSRNGPILAIAEEGSDGLDGVADDVIFVPKTIDALSSIPTVVASQLFAYYVAKEKGTEIDQPRNLAKSVTVE